MSLRKILISAAISVALSSTSYADNLTDTNAKYCTDNGGTLETLTAVFGDSPRSPEGVKTQFCKIVSKDDGNTVYVNLKALSKHSNIVTSIANSIQINDPVSPTTVTGYMCGDLHGANIDMYASQGGFTNDIGYAGICVFGDGSAISIWTLYYIGVGKDQDIKNLLSSRSRPLDFDIPKIRNHI